MIILRVYQILRILLFPLIWIYSQLHSQRKIRYTLERKLNKLAPDFKADILFEISSEGELEQVLYLIIDYIREGKKIELIFSSDSVIKKCFQLKDDYPDSIRLLAIPFLSYLPFIFKRSLVELITAPKLIMCRYDFFPEMLEICLQKDFYIVAANGLSLKSNKGIKKYWYHQFYKNVKVVIASTFEDMQEIQRIYSHVKLSFFDFRTLQINQRRENRQLKYSRDFTQIEELRRKINDAGSSLILGSLWKQDLSSIDRNIWESAKQNKLYIAILPHDLSPENLNLIRSLIPQHHNIELISQRGILCELYSEFDHAFVGGGYEGSPGVHSLLEPYLANCFIYCGESTNRSSEYRAISENGFNIIKVSPSCKLGFEELKKNEVKDTREIINIYELEEKYIKIKDDINL